MRHPFSASEPLPKYRRTFANTNAQTVAQRVQLLHELVPEARAIAKLCCDDCYRQWRAYTGVGSEVRFLGLDIEPNIVEQNKARGIPCLQGDVLDKGVLAQSSDFDVVFFGHHSQRLVIGIVCWLLGRLCPLTSMCPSCL